MKSFGSSSGANTLSSGSWKLSDEGLISLEFLQKNKTMLEPKPRIPIVSNVVPLDKNLRQVKDLKIVKIQARPKGDLVLIDQSNTEYLVSIRNAGTTSTETDVTFFKGYSTITFPKQALGPAQLEDLLRFAVQSSSWKTYSKVQYLVDSKSIVLAKKVYSGEIVVIKRLCKIKGGQQQKETILEVVALQELSDCRNFIKYHGVYESKEEIQIVMDYFAETTLTDLISQKSLSEAQCIGILRQVLEFLVDMHAKGYTHRDIKLNNILIKKDSHKSYSARVIDFKYAVNMNTPLDKRTHKYCGTAGFTAPEVIKREPYSKNIDIFSVGCVFYSLLSRKLLFEYTGDWDSTLKLNLKCDVNPRLEALFGNFSKSSIELLKLMVNEKSDERIDAAEALEMLINEKGVPKELKEKALSPLEEYKDRECTFEDFEEDMDEGTRSIGPTFRK